MVELTSFRNRLLGEFDLAHVERTDACDLVSWMDDRRRSSLGPHEDNVDELRCRRHWFHLFEVVDWHDGCSFSLPSCQAVLDCS